MTTKLLSLALTSCLLASGTLGQSSPADDSEMLDWLSNYDAARAQARATGKPIFLEFRCAP